MQRSAPRAELKWLLLHYLRRGWQRYDRSRKTCRLRLTHLFLNS